jgi:hypothetical protein
MTFSSLSRNQKAHKQRLIQMAGAKDHTGWKLAQVVRSFSVDRAYFMDGDVLVVRPEPTAITVLCTRLLSTVTIPDYHIEYFRSMEEPLTVSQLSLPER